MATHDRPIVFVEDTRPLPPIIRDVETAIPAFIGATQKASSAVERVNAVDPAGSANTDLLLKPTLIRSVRDFEEFFGDAGAVDAVVHVAENAGVYTAIGVDDPTTYYPLYFAVRLFFDNGGQRCFVVSVGTRTALAPVPTLASLTSGVDAVAAEEDPTLIVVPEAVSLPRADYATLAAGIIAQCARRRDRFAILDLFDGANPNLDVATARAAFPTSRDLQFAAVYYPFLRTTLTYPYVQREGTSNALVALGTSAPADVASVAATNPALYDVATTALRSHRVTLPPSATVAGVYAATDAARGVWKAPANVALESVVEPSVAIDTRTAERLNVDTAEGKSINTIRAFADRGTLVWGARTLAGNDNEWKYVPIRRFFTLVEQSIDKGTQWVVFEPNDATTWAMARASIENYLLDKWKQGALLGAKAEEAFYVRCGLGTTMTAQDITDGRLIVEIGMAPVRPAEFVILRISHRMQAPP